MYDNIWIFGLISAAALVGLIVLAILSNFLPQAAGPTGLKIVFILFLIFGFSLVPLFIKLALAGNIAMWKTFNAPGNTMFLNFRNFVTQNETRIFYALLAFFWGGFLLGLAIAFPAMVEDGFFKP